MDWFWSSAEFWAWVHWAFVGCIVLVFIVLPGAVAVYGCLCAVRWMVRR